MGSHSLCKLILKVTSHRIYSSLFTKSLLLNLAQLNTGIVHKVVNSRRRGSLQVVLHPHYQKQSKFQISLKPVCLLQDKESFITSYRSKAALCQNFLKSLPPAFFILSLGPSTPSSLMRLEEALNLQVSQSVSLSLSLSLYLSVSLSHTHTHSF